MMKYFIIFFAFSATCFGADFNVRDFGAKGDGRTLDTQAIQTAIDKCVQNGGGNVILKGGVFLSGTVFLKSNVVLRVEKGAVLKACSDLSQFKAPLRKIKTLSVSPIGTANWYRSLIIAENAKNVRFTGGGVIDGSHIEDKNGEEGMRGFLTVLLDTVENFKFDNIVFTRSSNHALRVENGKDGVFDNVEIYEGWDGIHIHRGENIVIKNCRIYTGDDSIAGGFWDNVEIYDCILNSSCNGMRLHLPIKNCVFKNLKIFGEGRYPHRTSRELKRRNTYSAISLQPSAWALDTLPGNVENVVFENIEVDNVRCAFHISTCKGNKVKNVYINNFRATNIGCSPISIENWLGFSKRPVFDKTVMVGGKVVRTAAGEIDGVYIKNFSAKFKGFGEEFKNAPLDVLICDARALPWWGFYAKNVKNLNLENVKIETMSADARPAFFFENVEGFKADDVEIGTVKFSETKILGKISLDSK